MSAASAPTWSETLMFYKYIFRSFEGTLEVTLQELTSFSYLSIINVYNQLNMSLSESLVLYDQLFTLFSMIFTKNEFIQKQYPPQF